MYFYAALKNVRIAPDGTLFEIKNILDSQHR